MGGGLLRPPFLSHHFPIEKTKFLGWIFFYFPKVHIKLGKVKKFGVNQIKNGAVGAIFSIGRGTISNKPLPLVGLISNVYADKNNKFPFSRGFQKVLMPIMLIALDPSLFDYCWVKL